MKNQVITEVSPELDVRLWQAWVEKNRELDRRGATKRLKFILLTLVVAVVGAALYIR